MKEDRGGVRLESVEEDRELIDDIKDNLRNGSRKELVKECMRLMKKLI